MGIFKAYDIRGIYGENLTEKEAYLIGYYLTKFKNLKEFKVANDGRNSREILTKFFIQGMLDANCTVKYLGMLSTPNFYHSLFEGLNDGVVITASHNAAELNGFKIMLNLESFDSRNGLFELEKLVLNDNDDKLKSYNILKDKLKTQDFNLYLNSNKNIIVDNSSVSNYISFLTSIFNNILTFEEIQVLKEKSFGIDFSSGVSSISGTQFFNSINLKFNFYNDKVDGNFPVHAPDPVKAIDFLKEKKGENYFTAAFDGDGDRICFYDNDSNQILTDFTIAKYIDFFNKTTNSKRFVCDLRVSKIIELEAKNNNFQVDFIRVGRAFYQAHMKKYNCKFGAELSGHLFFNDFNNLDNPDIALIYMLKIIAQELLKNNEIKFKNIFEKFELYHKLPETNIKVKNTKEVFDKLNNKFKKNISSKIDGLSFDFDEFWFNIRASNTEPIIRINFEGKDLFKTKLELENLIAFIEKND